MKHVNGDMEDLFRRAAAKYPLRTDSADWDSLAAALDKDPGPPSDADKDDKRRRRGIFWWWLLLPLAVGAGIYSWHATGRPPAHLSKAGTQAGETQVAGRQGGEAQGARTQRAGEQAGTQGAGTQPGGSSAGGARPLESAAQGGGISAQAGGITARAEAGSAGGTGSTTGGTGSAAEAGKIIGESEAGGTGSAAEAGGIIGGRGGGGSVGKKSESENSAAREAVASRLDLQRLATAGAFNVVVDVKAPAARKDSSAKQTKKATAKSKGGHGYIGLTGAPDFSTVKMQATKGVGTTWGLLLGYAFNSHWAVESGVYLDRKKYYTAGEYFKGETLPAYTTLQSVNGSCNMWEIPLNVRYNFNPGSKITWFATAGASSYFMTKQQYAGQFERGGATWPANWTDSGHNNYLFSIINLSGGFEQRIGRIGNLRIEPYLRIPLSGIGTGRLPIMSAGLNVGITHQLW